MSLILNGNGVVQNIDAAQSGIATKTDLDSLSSTVSSVSGTVSTLASDVSNLSSAVDTKYDTPVFCLATATISRSNVDGNGAVYELLFSTLAFNQTGFSLNSGRVVVPKTATYQVFMSYEGEVTSSTYSIRAARVRPRVDGTAVGWNGSYFHNTPQTFSNTHYTYNSNYVFNISQGSAVSMEVSLWPSTSPISDSVEINMYMMSLT